jgi:1-acyl-sn-glycerol-3-phosphate acyltransferase
MLILFLPGALAPSRRATPEIHGVIRLLWWLNLWYCHVVHRLQSTGPAPLPERGAAILIANHTCGIDHMILQAATRRLLGFIIAKEFYDFWACRPFCRMIGCIPVRRDGRDLAALRAALRALEEGRVVPIFPEGKILPTSGRELGEGKSGVAFIALHARVPVIPAYIRGTPETSNVWKALLTPSRARIVFGAPIDLSEFPPSLPIDKPTLAAVTERLMDAIRELRQASLGGEEAGGGRAAPVSPAEAHGDPRRIECGPVEISRDRPAPLGA